MYKKWSKIIFLSSLIFFYNNKLHCMSYQNPVPEDNIKKNIFLGKCPLEKCSLYCCDFKLASYNYNIIINNLVNHTLLIHGVHYNEINLAPFVNLVSEFEIIMESAKKFVGNCPICNLKTRGLHLIEAFNSIKQHNILFHKNTCYTLKDILKNISSQDTLFYDL